MKLLKKVLLVFLFIGAGLALLFGSFIYITRYKVSDIDSDISADGGHEVIFQAIGEPDWPFGYSHARLALKDKNGIILKYKIKVANDGGTLYPDNWNVSWQDDCVQIVICGEEQGDELYTLYFNGTVTEGAISEKNSTKGNRKLQDTAPLSTENINFSTAAVENEKGETVFSTSISNFIGSFNSIYKQMYAADYLTPSSNWMHLHDESPCFEYDSVHYIFSADKRIASMPTISIYTPENEDGIYEMKLTFDDHGYQESLYEEFEDICFCSLKTVLPELSNTHISDLYEKLYLQTKENFWGDYYPDCGTERPALNMIYQYGTVGLYGYYGAGTTNICAIPLTQGATVRFEQEGVEIIEVK